jgi:quercetin dioxygenase-like cupin family protein
VSTRMKSARARHRVENKKLLVAFAIVCAAAAAGFVIARWFGSGTRKTPLTPRTTETTLIGHEFSVMGHDFHVLESSRDTDDGSLRLDYSAPPRANVSEHTHHFQQESFEVVSGKLGVRVGGQGLILTPGENAMGPPGVPHAWWNPSDEDRVRFVAGIRPGIEVESMFETVLGLMEQGKTFGPLPKNPLQTAVLAREIASWVVLGPVEKALLAPLFALAFVGGLFGYKARYP